MWSEEYCCEWKHSSGLHYFFSIVSTCYRSKEISRASRNFVSLLVRLIWMNEGYNERIESKNIIGALENIRLNRIIVPFFNMLIATSVTLNICLTSIASLKFWSIYIWQLIQTSTLNLKYVFFHSKSQFFKFTCGTIWFERTLDKWIFSR